MSESAVSSGQTLLLASLLAWYFLWWVALIIVRVGQFKGNDLKQEDNPVADKEGNGRVLGVYDNSDPRQQQQNLNGIYKRAVNVSIPHHARNSVLSCLMLR